MLAHRNVNKGLKLMIIQFKIFAYIFVQFIVFLEKCFDLIKLFSINIYLTAFVLKYQRKLPLTHARNVDMIYILFVFLANNQQSEHRISNKSKVYYPIICSQNSFYALIFFTDFTFPISLPMISLSEYLFFCGCFVVFVAPCVNIQILLLNTK